MPPYELLKIELTKKPCTWLITGVAGFIGCNLLETLLKLGQRVVGLDNFSTGHRWNLEQIRDTVNSTQWANFTFIEGDIRDLDTCRRSARAVDYILHQAALGSVPRSFEDPICTHQSNVDGFVNMLVVARDTGVKRFVYASSSSVYGDHSESANAENAVGKLLSPYAVTKYVNELYADVFASAYSLQVIGLRYFNIFGPHQDPEGAYAAVIPKWITSMLKDEIVFINGDGQTSRDFCYVANTVQANLLAATTETIETPGQICNVAMGENISLNELFNVMRTAVQARMPGLKIDSPRLRDFRAGDVRYSLANIDKAKAVLGYQPTHTATQGLKESIDWYIKSMAIHQ